MTCRPGFDGDSPYTFETRRLGPPPLRDEDVEELKIELTKVEDEIQTLRKVLLAREKYAADIRCQLGDGPFSVRQLKQDLAKSWVDVQTSSPYISASATLEDISRSNAYRRTQASLSHAGQVTSAALSSMGMAITKRLGEMRALPLAGPRRSSVITVPPMRNPSTFKSFEGKKTR